jgi:hypothetical protein
MVCAFLTLGVACVTPTVTLAAPWAVEGCTLPAGGPAPIDGWDTQANGAGADSNATNACPAQPGLVASDASQAPQANGTGPMWVFSAPAGATITGGSLIVSLTAPQGQAYVATPQDLYDAADVLTNCQFTQPCDGGLAVLNAQIPISHPGGTQIFAAAECIDAGGCPAGAGANGVNALVAISQSSIELTAQTTPQATAFTGSLLQPNAHGTASLQFTASEAAPGPGVDTVSVLIDGTKSYSGTPDSNGGHCASVGTDPSGVAEYLYLDPCALNETVDLPIDTTDLTDGQHELKVIVTDAAGVASTVLDQTITTLNRTTVSALLSAPPTATLGAAPTYAVILNHPSATLARGVTRSYDSSQLTLGGTLKTTAGVPAPGVPISLVATPAGGPVAVGKVVATATTNASGAWTLNAPRGASRELRIAYGTPPSTSGASSVSFAETVRPSLTFKVTAPGSARLVFSGHLAIAPLGNPRPLVLIEVHAAGGWETVGSAVRINSGGRYRYTYTSSAITIGRRFTFRATSPATSAWQTATSATRKAVVH